MSWEKITEHLFDRYCVEGEDKVLCNLMQEHDKEVRAKEIDELVNEAMRSFTEYDLTERIPTVVGCKMLLMKVAEQLKEGGK